MMPFRKRRGELLFRVQIVSLMRTRNEGRGVDFGGLENSEKEEEEGEGKGGMWRHGFGGGLRC